MIRSRLVGKLAALAVLAWTAALALPGSALASPTCANSSQTISHIGTSTLIASCDRPGGFPLTYAAFGTDPMLEGTTVGGFSIRFTPTTRRSSGEVLVSYEAANAADPFYSYIATIDVTVTDIPPVCTIIGAPYKSVSHTAQTTFAYSCTDADGDTLTPSVSAAHGDAVISSPGVITYTPSAGSSYTGSDAISLTATENSFPLNQTDVVSAPVEFDVTITDQAPACTLSGGGRSGSAALSHTAQATFAFNCTDADGDAITPTLSAGAHGDAVVSSPGVVTYTPTAGSSYYGVDTISLTASEDAFPSVSALPIEFDFIIVDYAPICTFSGSSTVTVHAAPTTFAYTCTDADGDAITPAVTTPAHGNAQITSPGVISYTPTAGSRYLGADSFALSASEDAFPDRSGFPRYLNVTIANANPVCAQNDSAQTRLGGPPLALVFDCTDADGDPLTYSIFASGAHGSAVLDGQSASATYTPTSVGTDRVIVTAFDPYNSTGFAVNITVLPADPIVDPPVLVSPPVVAPVVTPTLALDPAVTPPVVVTPPLATGPTRLQVEKPGVLAKNTLFVSLTCPTAMGKVCKAFVRPSGKGYVRSLGARGVTVRLGASSAFKLTIPSYAAKTLRAYAGKNLRFIVKVTTTNSLGKRITVRKQIVVHVPR